MPAVLVAHELADAQAFADRLAVLDRGRIFQVGDPGEVVLRPVSQRVAELVGYRSFVPVTAPAGAVAGVHPERVAIGAHPGLGVALAGPVRDCRPSGAGWEADIEVSGVMLSCHLADRPPIGHSDFPVTLLDPPCFGPDGVLLPRPGASHPEQASA